MPGGERGYNPLEKRQLAESIARALLRSELRPLPPEDVPSGTGIYVLYYAGGFPAYDPLAAANRAGARVPIYVGRAVPRGSRSMIIDEFSSPESNALANRLSDHAASITRADNLAAADFRCQFLLLDDVWVPLGEALLIQHFNPLWNHVVTGFGIHDPGGNRPQARSDWDTLHPGRADRWRVTLKAGRPVEAIEADIAAFFASTPFQRLLREDGASGSQ